MTAALLLLSSLAASRYAYDWARLRIVSSAAFPSAVPVTAALPHTQDPEAASMQAASAASDDGAQSAGDTAVVRPAAAPPINVLVMGIDARPDEQGPSLTDTLLLLSVNLQTQTAGMLSIPRDLWVPIPGLDVAAKINTVYRTGELQDYPGGGPQLAKDTVSSFIGQPVQYYVRVSFDGFVEMIDLIGGVDVTVPSTIHDEQYPTADYGVETFHLDAGLQHLDGATALKYVRTRNVDSDYGRAHRQQQVLRAVMDRVKRADMLTTLLARAPRLLYTMRSSIDTDMPMSLQLELANYLGNNELREVRQLVLDGTFGEETYSDEGAWILVPDRTRVRAALSEFFGPAIAEGDGRSVVAVSDPGAARVEILNGSGEPGMAARTRDLLEARGWNVVSIGDADRGDYAHTLIVNYGVTDEVINKVNQDLNLAPTKPKINGLSTSASADMRIVVGRDLLSNLK